MLLEISTLGISIRGTTQNSRIVPKPDRKSFGETAPLLRRTFSPPAITAELLYEATDAANSSREHRGVLTSKPTRA